MPTSTKLGTVIAPLKTYSWPNIGLRVRGRRDRVSWAAEDPKWNRLKAGLTAEISGTHLGRPD